MKWMVKCVLWHHLGEVFIKLWVKQCHLWLYILIQHQREHWEHGVDCSVAVNKSECCIKTTDTQRQNKMISIKISTQTFSQKIP